MIELFIAAAVTAIACPMVRRLMLHWDVIDIPNHRSSHSFPTPRGGGLACAAGVLVGSGEAAARGRAVTWPVLAAAGAVAALGFLDDRHSVEPRVRLVAQVVVGAALGAAVGGLVGLFAGVLVVPAALNVVNFMDGINGITGITMTVWGASALFVGTANGDTALTVLGGVTAGSALGFLPANLPSARLFLGDAGSYLFGGLIAGGILVGAVGGASVALLVAPLCLYLVDVNVTLLRRLRRGAPLLQAHRDHVYQQLSGPAGLPHGVVALAVGIASPLLTLVWLIPVGWVSAALTLLLTGTYLASPRLVQRWPSSIASRAGERS